MVAIYYLTNSAATVPGAHTKGEFSLSASTLAPQGLPVSFANNYNDWPAGTIALGWISANGEPGPTGTTGNWSVEITLSLADANLTGWARVARVSSANVIQAASTWNGGAGDGSNADGNAPTNGESLGTTVTHTFTFTALDLGTWATGDKVMVELRVHNAHAHGGDESIEITTWSDDAEVVVPTSAIVTVNVGQVSETEQGTPIGEALGQISETEMAFPFSDAKLLEVKQGVEVEIGIDQLVIAGDVIDGNLDAYLSLPGTSGDYASTPDAAAVEVAGDIDIRVDMAMADWTPAAFATIAAKFLTTGNQRSWQLGITTSGLVQFTVSPNGTATAPSFSTVGTGLADGVRTTLRVTLDVDNGASGRTARFFTGPTVDGPWTQLGGDDVDAGITSIFNGTAAITIGGHNNGTAGLWGGQVHAFRVRDGNGDIVIDANFTNLLDGVTSFVDQTGLPWTVNGTAEIVGPNVVAASDGTISWPLDAVDPHFVGVNSTIVSPGRVFEAEEAETIDVATAGLLVEDDFNRADSDTVGDPWVERSGDWDISSNGVIQTDAQSVPGLLLYDLPIDTDHWIEGRLATSNGTGQIGLALRTHATDFTGVFMEVADGSFKVIQATNGSPNTVAVGDTHTHATGDLFRAETEGNTVRLFLDDVEVLTHTTTFAAGNTRVGFHLNENNSGVVRWDDFRAGTLPYVPAGTSTTVAVEPASEAEAGLATSAEKDAATGQALEVETAASVTTPELVAVAVDPTVEGEVGLSATVTRIHVPGQTQETEAGLVVTARRTYAAGQTAETEGGLPFTLGSNLLADLVTETETAHAVTASKQVGLNPSTELETAFGVTVPTAVPPATLDVAIVVAPGRSRALVAFDAGRETGLLLELDAGRDALDVDAGRSAALSNAAAGRTRDIATVAAVRTRAQIVDVDAGRSALDVEEGRVERGELAPA